MNDQEIIKEANRLNYMVKGSLLPRNTSVKTCQSVIDSYTKRLWGNHEASVHEEGFEEVWFLKRVLKRF